jgi:hypothetical protein
MIMLSRDEFMALRARDSFRTPDQDVSSEQHHPCWPANEVMLQCLIRGGKSAAEISALYDVGTDQVARLRAYHNV